MLKSIVPREVPKSVGGSNWETLMLIKNYEQ